VDRELVVVPAIRPPKATRRPSKGLGGCPMHYCMECKARRPSRRAGLPLYLPHVVAKLQARGSGHNLMVGPGKHEEHKGCVGQGEGVERKGRGDGTVVAAWKYDGHCMLLLCWLGLVCGAGKK
jgi:hypothetical protein